MGFFPDITKEVLAGIVVWALSGLLAWLISKISFVRKWLDDHPEAKHVVAIYARFLASGLEVRVGAEKQIDGRVLACPPGSFVAGWTFQDQPGLSHGALWGPSAICRKVDLNVNPKS